MKQELDTDPKFVHLFEEEAVVKLSTKKTEGLFIDVM